MLNKYFYRKVTINYSNLRASSRPSRSSRLIFKATIIQKNDIIKQLMESYLAKEMLKSSLCLCGENNKAGLNLNLPGIGPFNDIAHIFLIESFIPFAPLQILHMTANRSMFAK